MAKITVIDADGNPALINEESLPVAVQERGARLPTAEEAQALRDRQEYGEGVGNTLKAGAAGAARTLTFGLSDLLASDIGRGEDLAKLREQNPTASIVGEVAGAVAPAVLSGGESLLAQGGRLAGSGVRAASAAGRAVEGAAARSLAGLAEKGLAGRAVATGLAKAAGGAAEGAIFGAGQAVTESALEDHELTAEQVLQSVGAGALLGGVVGGGIGAGGELASAGAKAVKGAAQTASTKVREIFTRASKGETAAQREAAQFAQMASTLTGAPQQEIEFFAKLAVNPDREARKALDLALSGDDAIMQSARKIAKAENEFDELFEKVTDKGRGTGKLEGLKTKLNDSNIRDTFDASANLLETVKSTLDDMELRAKDAAEFEIGPVRKMQASLKKTLATMEDPGTESLNARLFDQLDQLKRDAQKIVNKASKQARTSNAARDTFEALNELQESMRTHLEDSKLWGEAAAAQADVNKPWTRFLQNERYERADFHVRRSGNANFEDVYENDPAKWMGFFKRQGTPAADIDTAYLQERLAARNELVDAMHRQFATGPESAAQVARLKELSDDVAKTMLETQRVSTLQNRFKAIEGDGTISGIAAGALAGFSTNGLRGAVKGAVLSKALSNPQQSLRQMAAAQGFTQRIGSLQAVANAAKSAGERITKAVDGFIGVAKKGGRAAASLAPRAAIVIDKPGVSYLRAQRRGEDPQELYARQVEELRGIVQNPAVTADRVAKSTERMALLKPSASTVVQAKAMQTAQFLLSKAPRPIQAASDLITGKKRPVSKNDLATFDRYVRAAAEPSTVLEDLAGGYVSNEAAETLRTLYPKTVEALRARVSDRLAGGAELTHKQELLLSRLFATPFSSTLEPGFVATLQANWNSGAAQAAAQQSQSPQPAVRQTGLAQSELGQNDLTRSQRLSAR
jgi:hypothetical protein